MYETACRIFGVPSQTSVFLLVLISVTGYTSEIHRMPPGGSVHYIHLSAVSLNPGGRGVFLYCCCYDFLRTAGVAEKLS
jgi:hypothetical protein